MTVTLIDFSAPKSSFFQCSVIQPIALYGSEVWGSLSQQNYSKWDKHPIETLHVEFCRNILKTQRKTPNNACRAELGHYPLMIPKKSITILDAPKFKSSRHIV